jgi:hypothetical protein
MPRVNQHFDLDRKLAKHGFSRCLDELEVFLDARYLPPDCTAVDQKAVDGVDRLVARTDKRSGEEDEQFVGTRAAHNQCGVNPIGAAIAARSATRQLKNGCPTGRGACADIRLDVEHARPWFGTFESQH